MNPQIYDHHCNRCELSMSAESVCVGGSGSFNNRMMLIGEAPGSDEDKAGIPFVGRSGRLLNSCLVAAGVTRNEVFVTNVVKCRPPNNRKPTDNEVFSCQPYLMSEINLIKPLVVLLLGSSALKHVLGQEGIMKKRGVWQEHLVDWGTVNFLPTYHPSFCLRRPQFTLDLENDVKEFVDKWRSLIH